MKKKTVNTVLMFIIFSSVNIFAQSGFQAELNVPFGGSLSFKSYTFDSSLISKDGEKEINKQMRADAGFETGVNVLLGYKISLPKNLSLSLLLDLGYNYDFLGYVIKKDNVNYHYWFQLHTLMLGILPKINLGNFAFGLGAGVKIPLSGHYYQSRGSKHSEFIEGNDWYDLIEYSDLKKYFKSYVIPYIKLTFDYSINVHKNIAIIPGAYIGYDFMIETKRDKNYFKKTGLSAFDFGITLGMKFTLNN